MCGIKTVLYLDVLLLVNFAIGALLLLAAGLVCGVCCSGVRVVCGAAVAAASSLALLLPTAPWPLAFLYKAATGAAAVAAVYAPIGARGFARLACWYVLLNLTLTGAALLPGAQGNNFCMYVPLSPGVLLACAGGVYLVLRGVARWFGRADTSLFAAELMLAAGGPAIPVRVLCDTGLTVTEPLSGRAVVLVRTAAVVKALPPALRAYLEGPPDAVPPPELGVRMVPCTTVAGHCVLPAVPAAELRCRRGGHLRRQTDLYAAFCELPPPPSGWEVLAGGDVAAALNG